MRLKGSLLFVLVILTQLGFAQKFAHKADLRVPQKDGFFRIQLNPGIVNKLNKNLSDIRLYDWKNREVPYLIEKTDALQTRKYFRKYPVLKNEIVPQKKTVLIVQNPAKNKINNLSLVIKNTNVHKKASLSGSSDLQQWYALEADYYLQSISDVSETSAVKVLNFPVSDYEYYRLEINDSATAPLNILAAGYYDFNAEKGQYTEVPDLVFTRTDSSAVRKTYLRFKSTYPIRLDQLVFEIDSPTFYLRNTSILVPQVSYNRHGKKQVEMVAVLQFQLGSDRKNEVQIPDFIARDFYIEIANKDNPPLQIRSIRAFQLNTFLIAELKEGKQYELRFADENAAQPAYDLVNFKDKIPADLPVLKPLEITGITAETEKQIQLNTYFKDKTIIWVVLVAVLALVGLMTAQMLKETKK